MKHYMSFRVTGLLNFVHRPEFEIELTFLMIAIDPEVPGSISDTNNFLRSSGAGKGSTQSHEDN
jgi:hypothetical protein